MDTSIVFWVIGATLFSGLIGLTGGILVLWKEKLVKKLMLGLVSFAAGTMLGAAFFHILPETISEAGTGILPFVVIGIGIFFLLEKSMLWHHCHEEHCEIHSKRYTILFGDALHNFTDGIIIAASFLINIPLGIIATFAVLLHEIPQEIGDFGVLLYTKLNKNKILLYNIITALTSVAGAVITVYLLGIMSFLTPYLEAVAAGGFIYIAAADLLPETHKERKRGQLIMHTALFFAGMIVIWTFGKILSP